METVAQLDRALKRVRKRITYCKYTSAANREVVGSNPTCLPFILLSL